MACVGKTACCPNFIPLVAALSQVYIDLTDATEGVLGDLCDQNFRPVFDAIATQIVVEARYACTYEIPPPPGQNAFEPENFTIQLEDGMNAPLENRSRRQRRRLPGRHERLVLRRRRHTD